MTRLAFLWHLFDARDRLMLAGLLVVGLAVSSGVGYVTGVHERRVAVRRACQETLRATAARRGYQIVTVADPCPMGRGRWNAKGGQP